MGLQALLWYTLEREPKHFRVIGGKTIKSLGKAEVFFISVASPVFFDYPPKFHQKSQIYRTPLTGGLAKRSAKIKITPIPNSSLIPCFDMFRTKLNPDKVGFFTHKIKEYFSFLKAKWTTTTASQNN